MRLAVCLLLLATLGCVEGRARFRLTFYRGGLPSSPACKPTTEAEITYADGESCGQERGAFFLLVVTCVCADGVCRTSIFNGNLSSIVRPTTQAGYDAVIRTFSGQGCVPALQTSERFIAFFQCMHNGGQDGTTGRSFSVNLVAGSSVLAASAALLLLALLF